MPKLEDMCETNRIEIVNRRIEIEESEEEFEDSDGETETFIANNEGGQYRDADFGTKQVSDPNIVSYTLESLFGKQDRGFDMAPGTSAKRKIEASSTDQIELEPEYQRDVVWDEGRSSALIASIFQGYFIPPIIFNVVLQDHKSGDGTQTICRICVDGKQRITSVKKFMEGRIGVLDNRSPPIKWYFCHPIINGVQQVSNHNILPESTKVFFKNKGFWCYEYQNLPKNTEEDMFQMVQRGVPLTPAERMRGLSSRLVTFGKKIEQEYHQVVNLSKQSRASGFRCVVTIFIQIRDVISLRESKDFNNEWDRSNLTLHAAPGKLIKMLLDEKSFKDSDETRYEEVFDRFQELVNLSSTESSRTKLGKVIIPNSAFHPTPDYLKIRGAGHVKTFSPLELVATATLIAVHGESRPPATLIGDIKGLRILLRTNHQDLRLNNHCWATAWDFISKRGVNLRVDGQADGDSEGEQGAMEEDMEVSE